MDEAELNNALK